MENAADDKNIVDVPSTDTLSPAIVKRPKTLVLDFLCSYFKERMNRARTKAKIKDNEWRDGTLNCRDAKHKAYGG